MTQEQFARQILEIAIGAGNAEARCGMVIEACEAAEAAGLTRAEVLSTMVMALVSTGNIALNASRMLAETLADEPRGQILR